MTISKRKNKLKQASKMSHDASPPLLSCRWLTSQPIDTPLTNMTRLVIGSIHSEKCVGLSGCAKSSTCTCVSSATSRLVSPDIKMSLQVRIIIVIPSEKMCRRRVSSSNSTVANVLNVTMWLAMPPLPDVHEWPQSWFTPSVLASFAAIVESMLEISSREYICEPRFDKVLCKRIAVTTELRCLTPSLACNRMMIFRRFSCPEWGKSPTTAE
mmetsp:Transcript_2446/g.6082  ORF Transcript_2446/g.6082 Transcript_2446/m.6082 type:complete len:212 (-) Transcript_2446:728-1363(-)